MMARGKRHDDAGTVQKGWGMHLKRAPAVHFLVTPKARTTRNNVNHISNLHTSKVFYNTQYPHAHADEMGHLFASTSADSQQKRPAILSVIDPF